MEQEHHLAAVGIHAQLGGALLLAGEKLSGPLDGQLVRREIVRHVRTIFTVDEVGPVATDTHRQRLPVGARAQRDRADLARVDVLGGFVEARVQSLVATVEGPQVPDPVGLTHRDVVEAVLHAGREVVVDQPAEVLLQQPGHGEGRERRDQGRALLEHVLAPQDRVDDAGVGRRAPDATPLQLLDQGRFRQPGGRLGRVLARRDLVGGEHVTLLERREDALLVCERFVGVVGALDIGATVAGKRDRLAPRFEDRGQLSLTDRDAHSGREAPGVLHLTRDGALPDQLVEATFVGTQLSLGLFDAPEAAAGRPDGLVRFLGVLDLALVDARLRRKVVAAVLLADQLTRRADGFLRQRGGVRPHVGDPARLVEPLRDRHGPPSGPAQLAVGLLLQGARRERRRRPIRGGLLLDRGDTGRAAGQAGLERLGAGAIQHPHARALQLAVFAEVPPPRDALAADAVQLGVDTSLLAGEVTDRIPPARRLEGQPLPLSLDDEAHRHRLDPPRRELGADLLPQQRRDLVAVEPVDDPPSLLRPHEVLVDLARVLQRALDRFAGDLVEDQPANRDLGLQHLEEVPGDALPLAVFIGGEVELIGVLEEGLELLDLGLLVGGHDVERLEVRLDVHAEPRPLLLLVGRGDLAGAARQVANVADRRLDHEVPTQVLPDGAGLGRRLDDDKGRAHGASGSDAVWTRSPTAASLGGPASCLRVQAPLPTPGPRSTQVAPWEPAPPCPLLRRAPSRFEATLLTCPPLTATPTSPAGSTTCGPSEMHRPTRCVPMAATSAASRASCRSGGARSATPA